MQPGIYITQVGVSVTTAADYQYVFNSNWPSLQCAFDDLVTIPGNGSLVLNHNLGFYPLTMGWIIQNNVSYGRIFAASENFNTSPQTSVSISFDKNNVYLSNSSNTPYQVDVKCYNLDISTSVNYTLPQFPSAKTPYDPTTGIKVSKFNKQIISTDLRDFILHSRAQSPAVLSIVTGTTPISYTNPAGYVPWTLGFYMDSNGRYNGLAPGTQQTGAVFLLGKDVTNTTGGITATGSAVMASTVPSMNLSLVVLRDPLVLPNNLQAQYNG